ncbi:MAG: hypothetical protein JHD35_25920 [Sphingopyxis sp.]|nr:hypothetical protein [Sphingopyxis sp.]
MAVEGKLSKSDGEPYLLRFTVQKGWLARKHCAIIRGVEELGWNSRWKAKWLTNRNALAKITGVTLAERHPTYRFAEGGGQHTHEMCTFALQIEKIQTL